jgi:hypothetical protein
LRLNGAGKGPVSPEWMIPKALWLKRHERDLYDRAATICEYQDFVIRRLTGQKCREPLHGVDPLATTAIANADGRTACSRRYISTSCVRSGLAKSLRRERSSDRSMRAPPIISA